MRFDKKIPSHTNAKKREKKKDKKKRLNDSNLALLLVVLKWHKGSERVTSYLFYIYICGYIVVLCIQTYTRAHARTYVHTLTRTNGERAGES